MANLTHPSYILLMQVKPGANDQARSFAATARRAQIVEATIETIAELGYGQTTFARIAERAGLSSTRLISYHFADKQELMGQIVGDLYTEIGVFVGQRMAAHRTAAAALDGYIHATIEYIAEHRTHMKALLGIFLSGALTTEPSGDELVTLLPAEQILIEGQRQGEFRSFDTAVMAASIQRSLDGIPLLLESRPDLDLALCARELATIYELATRRTM